MNDDGTLLTEEERKAAYRRAWFGFIAMMFGNFMAILDIQIVASSLNQIQAGLAATSLEAHLTSEGLGQLYLRLLTDNFEEATLARKEGREPEFRDRR